MLDLTYIFPDEPIEEDSIYVMAQFPNERFARWLKGLLLEYGIKWEGAGHVGIRTGQTIATEPLDESYIADMNIGCQSVYIHDTRNMAALVHEILPERLKAWRWYSPEYKIILYRNSQKHYNLWLHFVITNTPELFS